jgi:serine phosphatase RsbU (regulator of sigma subunit)
MSTAPAKPSGAALHWQDAEKRAHLFALKSRGTVVGRRSDCDLMIFEETISRQHAKIVCSQGTYFLVDLGTMFGTMVNGIPVKICALRNGDRLEFGKHRDVMIFRLDVAPELMESLDEHIPDLGLQRPQVLSLELLNVLHNELRESQKQRIGFEADLALAQEVQEALLPANMPEIEGFRLCAYYMPTRFVGGDFYDFIPKPETSLCGVLGDVSGKGIAAALLSGVALGCLASHLRTGSNLEDAVQILNGLVCEKGGGKFLSLFLFEFESNGRGRFVSAGHNTVFVYRHEKDEIMEIPSNNMIVGAFLSSTFCSGAIDLAPGDLMLIYSDGLTEAENANEDMLGEEPVRRLLKQDSHSGAGYVQGSLLDLLATFTSHQHQNDDITFILVQRM